ncbi:sensor histidine kinase [Hippea maritima]|uniref:histidine kinase n=1 Tax=Hippea maritima (strain ATCC 700847 / DSM 10411 / MH2) TaxID=760142 RepID=F2LV86_HIPMA|nr:HAMP domain-containing sensor histidine kinase [Hippea maritima]AEA33670.1 integral membrane sensor signal transduction histidine kinase [Hippea maritima DSM 10411]
MVKTDYFADVLKTNLLILFVRLLSVSGAVIWVTYPNLYLANLNKLQIIYVYNIIIYIYTALFVIRFFIPKHSKRSEVFCLFSFIFDQIVISYFTYNTGGFPSPFYSGYFVVITLSAFVLGTKLSLLVAFFGAAFYVMFNYTYGIGIYNIVEIIYRIIPFFIIALPTGVLSDLAEKHLEEIGSLNEELKEKNRKLGDSLFKIERMQRQLIKREKENALLELTESVAHRLRNPLMSLGGMASILEKKIKKGANPEELVKYIDYIKSESKNISSIINNLLEMSDKNVELKFVKLDVLMDAVLSEFDLEIKKNNIKVNLNVENMPPIRTDEKKLKIALHNIIDNCVKVMKNGGELSIAVATSKSVRNTVEITIKDTGPGIPKSIIKNIFKPFESGGSVKKGVGLPIAKHSIEILGGELYIESEIGKGTTFKILLPM